uniref:Uncharacterized protein n=1 Tax=Lepeophtheirus salmonis TaxID=72036 RepID=A0A0K2T3U5_LEPSM
MSKFNMEATIPWTEERVTLSCCRTPPVKICSFHRHSIYSMGNDYSFTRSDKTL